MEVALIAPEEIITETVENGQSEPKCRKYLKGRLLGRGGFAHCYQGVNLQTNTKVAIKVIDKKNLLRSRAKQKMLSEIKIHKILNHPNVVKFLTVFQDVRRVFIIVELCQNNALSDLVRRRKRLSSMEVKRFMHQLIDAIEYLHSMKIIHRDLKMANIFLDEGMNIKVGDLGLATKLEYHQERKRTMCGTPNYIAPEIIQGGVGHSYEVDIWSAGVICYAMFYGRPPFQAEQITKTYQKIKIAHFDFPSIQGLSCQFKDFISHILVVDPKKRMTIKQMKEHPFLRQALPSITYNKITLTPVYDALISNCKTLLPEEQNVLNEQKVVKEKQSTDLTIKPLSSCNSEKMSASSQKQQRWEKESVACYVDYSTKYGLGYILSNGHYGVYFNDSSLLCLQPLSGNLYYFENPSISQKMMIQKQQIESLPDFQKKYALMKKFKVYLDEQLKSMNGSVQIEKNKEERVYLKQWLKTKHAIMFRLNNKIFQVDFFDGSRVSLNSETKKLLIKNKRGQVKLSSLQEAISQNDGEISRRIKYIREILNRIKQK